MGVNAPDGVAGPGVLNIDELVVVDAVDDVDVVSDFFSSAILSSQYLTKSSWSGWPTNDVLSSYNALSLVRVSMGQFVVAFFEAMCCT